MTDHIRTIQIEGEAARVLLANIKDIIGDDEEMTLTAVEGETSFLEAVDAALARIAEVTAHAEAIAAQAEALRARKERFLHQGERIRTALYVALGQASLRKLERPQATLSMRAVPPKAEILDEAAIPGKFWKEQEPKLDKKAVLDALKAKEDVPGASLSNGGETIAIRFG